MAGILELIGHVQQQGEAGRARGKQTRLADLMGQAFQAPREERQPIFGQMAQVDPQSAFDAEKGFRGMDDNARAQLGQTLAAFDTLPDEQKAQAYPQIAQQARSMLGLPVPMEWSPAMAPNIQKLAQVLGGAQQGTPAGVQEFQFLTQGLGTDDVAKARRIQLGLDGRASSAGFGFDTFKGMDGHERPTITDPRTGVTYIYDEGSRGYVPLGGVGGQQGGFQPPQQGGNPFSSLVAGVPGLQVNSTTRTPEQNAKVGGVPNSYHLTGQAIDIAPPGANGPAVRQWAARNGMEVIDEGDHWHLEPRGNAPRTANPALGVGRRPEDEAAAKTRAEELAKLGLLSQRGDIEADNAAKEAAARAAAEEQTKFLAELPKTVGKADEALAVIDKAINHPGRAVSTGLSGTIDPRAYLPGGAAADFKAVLEQLQGRAFLEAFESLKGGGQITEVEGNKATAAMARLKTTQSDEGFRQSLQDLRDVVVSARDRAIQKVSGGQRQQDTPRSNSVSNGGWSIEVSP